MPDTITPQPTASDEAESIVRHGGSRREWLVFLIFFGAWSLAQAWLMPARQGGS